MLKKLVASRPTSLRELLENLPEQSGRTTSDWFSNVLKCGLADPVPSLIRNTDGFRGHTVALPEADVDRLNSVNGPDFKKMELIPVIAQDGQTGEVLMLAYMNEEAYQETLRTGRICYYSRSRQKLWRKGEESGNVQELQALYFDCDADTLLVKVHQRGGAACHEGYKSCFFRRVDPASGAVTVEGEQIFDPAVVYGKQG